MPPDGTKARRARKSVPDTKVPRPGRVALAKTKTRLIIKADPSVKMITADVPELAAKAAEYVINLLVKYSVSEVKEGEKFNLGYNQLADVVASNECFEYLRDLIPKTKTVTTNARWTKDKRRREIVTKATLRPRVRSKLMNSVNAATRAKVEKANGASTPGKGGKSQSKHTQRSFPPV